MTAPKPTVPPDLVKGLFADSRRAWGIVAICTFGGFLIGYKLAASATGPALPQGIPGVPPEPHRCVECAERDVQRQMAEARVRNAPPNPGPMPAPAPVVVDPSVPIVDQGRNPSAPATGNGQPFNHAAPVPTGLGPDKSAPGSLSPTD